jgi:hypothetical protein
MIRRLIFAALLAAAPFAAGPVSGASKKTVEEIAKEHRKRFPKPITDGALAVDIVRADRDTR